MNPARTLGPDVVGHVWRGLWIYFIAPPIGMLAAAEVYLRMRGHHAVHCAKLHHDDGPCIFCGSEGDRGRGGEGEGLSQAIGKRRKATGATAA
jgi:hypothetical protein